MQFLGTGAAELFPFPFCDCQFCRRARQSGERPRKRSALLVNSCTCIDFGPDVLAASQQHDAPLHSLEHLFITHSHDDHFCLPNLDVLNLTDAWAGRTINIYLSVKAHAWLQGFLAAMEGPYRGQYGISRLIDAGRLRFIPVEPYRLFRAGSMQVLPIESNHNVSSSGEYALNYRIDTPDGRLLYTSDSGLYGRQQLEALKDSACTQLVMECTFGANPLPSDSTHLNAAYFIQNLRSMAQHGIINKNTRVFATHINQTQHFLHSDLQAYFDAHSPYPVRVAYDGMRA